MTTDLRTKLIQKGWVTEFNADTLTRLIEEHYAALADKPAVSSPTVMEIIELSSEIEAAGLGQVDFARAVLTRWGNPAPLPPADGEVAELVEWLQNETHHHDLIGETLLRRAAELLQVLVLVLVPVSVSERWPEFSDCDDADRVWCWNWAIGTWRLSRINRSIHTHWLPARALPLPEFK